MINGVAEKFVSAVRTEVKPCYGGYMVYVTFQDAVKMPEAPTNPTRILGLDPGLDNFLTALQPDW